MSATDVPCPACAAPVVPGSPACGSCGLRLVGQDAARLWQVNQQIASLRREADSLLVALRAPAPADQQAPARGAWAGPAHPGHPAVPPRRSTSSGQQLLLGFGALLLLSAVSVFAFVAWTLIGVVGQAVILTGVTVGAAASSRLASARGLTAAAHTAAVIAIGVSALMALGAWSLDLAGAGDLSISQFVAVAGLVLAALWAAYDALTARAWSPVGPTSAYLPAAVAALGASATSAVVATRPDDLLLGTGLVVVAAALLALGATVTLALDARRRTLPAATAALLALAAAGIGCLVLLLTAYDLDRGVPERYLAALVLLLVAAVLPVVRRVPGPAGRALTGPLTAPAVAGLALLGTGTVLLDVPGWGWAGLSAAASATLLLAPLRRIPVVVPRIAGALAPAAAALVVLTVETGGRTLAALLRGVDGTGPAVPVWVEVALPALWAAGCAVQLVRHRPGSAPAGAGLPGSALGVALGGMAALLLAVVHGTWEATVPVGLAWVVVSLVVARVAVVRAAAADADRGEPGRWWSALHGAALLAAGYAVVPLGQLLVEDVDGRLQAAGCWVVAAAVGWYAAAPGRLRAGYLAAALVSLGNALLLGHWGADQVELYTLPSAAAFALLGLAQHRTAHGSRPGSTVTMGPALSIALLPSLAVGTTGDDLLRLLLVTLAGLALLVLGVALALRAPVLAGSVTLGVVAVAQGSPFLAYVPAWLLLASAGAALLTLGVAWEAALQSGRRVGRWVHGLR